MEHCLTVVVVVALIQFAALKNADVRGRGVGVRDFWRSTEEGRRFWLEHAARALPHL